MTQLKKKAKEEIAATLRKHLGELQWDLNKNKREMSKLVERQTITKRKIAEINGIINAILPFKKGE